MIGERLKARRIALGLSLRALSSRVSVSHTTLDKYEKKIDTPDSTVLLELAKALDVRLDWFFRVPSVSIPEVAFRRRTGFGVKKQRAVLAGASEFLERYLLTEELAGVACDRFEMPHFPKAPARPMSCAEEYAQQLRLEWGLGLDPIECLVEELEDRGVKIILLAGNDEGFDGCSCWVGDSVPVIVISRSWPGDRQRFTIAHELGHLILSGVKMDEQEPAANRFAGAFLVPGPSVRKELGNKRSSLSLCELEQLKLKYGASMSCWVRRAHELSIISESYYLGVMRHFRKNGWHKSEPGEKVSHEEPRRMERMVHKLLLEGAVSEGRAAELLAQSIGELRRNVTPLGGSKRFAEAGC